jgi:hypothetical protein
MPNTTNFNWSTPADTDLVKNGASAIRTLGSAIDTSFVDFKGGTTGQVLKKTSNTDLDVEWGTASSGLTLINTTSFSAVSSISVNDVFSATYRNYVVIYDLTAASANNNHTLRLRVGGADNSTASSYKSATSNMLDNGTIGNNNTTGATSWFVGTTKSTDVEWSRVELHFFAPFATQRTNLLQLAIGVSGGGNLFSEYGNHGHNAATSFTGFTILFSSGTVTGSVSTYGLAV